MKPFRSFCAALLLALALFPLSASAGNPATTRSAFHDAMRKLWEDHVTWTRLFIVSDVSNLPDLKATTDRLLRNQTDIGNAVKPFYGDAAGNALTALLKDHIITAAEVVGTAKANDKAKQDDATKRWFSNADSIASFLSTANPTGWPLAEMKSMMHDHLNLTAQEATARLKSDWKSEIADYDKVHQQILNMADMLSEGIINQFPDKFTAAPEKVQGEAK